MLFWTMNTGPTRKEICPGLAYPGNESFRVAHWPDNSGREKRARRVQYVPETASDVQNVPTCGIGWAMRSENVIALL